MAGNGDERRHKHTATHIPPTPLRHSRYFRYSYRLRPEDKEILYHQPSRHGTGHRGKLAYGHAVGGQRTRRLRGTERQNHTREHAFGRHSVRERGKGDEEERAPEIHLSEIRRDEDHHTRGGALLHEALQPAVVSSGQGGRHIETVWSRPHSDCRAERRTIRDGPRLLCRAILSRDLRAGERREDEG